MNARSRIGLQLSAALLCCCFTSLALSQDCEQSHWTFDEGSGSTTADSVGSNDGTLTNMDDSAWVVGRVGSGALSFDGQDEYVIMDSPGDFDIHDTDHSWTAWFKTTEGGSIISKGPTGDVSWDDDDHRGGRSMFVTDAGVLVVDVGWVGALGGGTAVNDGEWHHAAMTVQFGTDGTNDTMVLYVDGAEDGRMDDWDIQEQRPNAEQDLKIGYTTNDFPKKPTHTYFTGEIDDVRFFDCALTEEEVAAIAAGRGGPSVPAQTPLGMILLVTLFLGGGTLLLLRQRTVLATRVCRRE